jgi:hypothetical protein
LTGGTREGAKGEPPVGHFSKGHGALFIGLCKGPPIFLASLKKSLRNFFFSSADLLAYDTIPEEIYLSG